MRDYEKAAKAALAVCTVELHEFAGGDCMGEYDPKRRHIRLDPTWGGLVPTLIHELVHHAFYERMASMGVMEEPAVDAVEAALTRHILQSPVRRKWWSNALKAKISEGV